MIRRSFVKNSRILAVIINIIILFILVVTEYTILEFVLIFGITNLLLYYVMKAQKMGLSYFDTRFYLIKKMFLILLPLMILLIIFKALFTDILG